LLLSRRASIRLDTSDLANLTRAPKPLTAPVYPGTTDVVRVPSDVTRGMGLDPDSTSRVEQALREMATDGNILTFRSRLVTLLRSLAPTDLTARNELAQRCAQYLKSCAGSRFDRRPGHEGERMVVQKGLKVADSATFQKAAQLDLFGAPPTQAKEAEKPKAAPAHAAGDWQPIPNTKHPGGQRRRRGGEWEYRYPDGAGGYSSSPKEETHAKPKTDKEKRAPRDRKRARILDAGSSGSGTGGSGDAPASPRTESERSGARTRAQAVAVEAVAANAPAIEETDSPQFVEQALTQPETPFGLSGPVEPPPLTDASPAITLHRDLMPDILESAKLTKAVINFPKPLELRDSTGAVRGRIEKLFSHQVEGAERIRSAWERGNGVLLSDAAGLGKTNTVLAAMQAHGGKRNLIVVPTAGKANLKKQWTDSAGMYGHTLHEMRDQKAESVQADDGYYICSYDELSEIVKRPDGKPELDSKGKPKRRLRPALFEGRHWDTITFDEAHSMNNPDSAQAKNGKTLMDRGTKVAYLSATPVTNVSDYHYLKKLGLWDHLKGEKVVGSGIRELEGKPVDDDESAFAYWALKCGAYVKALKYSEIKNPSSHVPMATIGATLHADGLSINRSTSLDGIDSMFTAVPARTLPPELQKAFATAQEICQVASAWVPEQRIAPMYKGWAAQYWEQVKAEGAIALGKEKLAAGKQVAIYTAFRTFDHAHLRYFPRAIREKAEKMSENPGKAALVGAMLATARQLDELLEQMPKFQPIVERLVDEFGGGTKVAEIHGSTRKPSEGEQAAYQSGKKKVVVATMSKGGTGISLHDTTGDNPRVQINLSLPWSARSFNQVAGRSHRLGSKSRTEMHWMIGDDETQTHQAAIVAKRLRSMGALTTGDPEITVDAGMLAAWEYASSVDSDDPEDVIKAVEAAAEADEFRTGDAEASRTEFREFASRRKAGRNLIDEHYAESVRNRRDKEFKAGRLSAERLRKHLGVGVKWRASLGVFEVDLTTVTGRPAERTATRAALIAAAAGASGTKQSYGGRMVLSLWVPPAGMPALSKRMGADEVHARIGDDDSEHLDVAKQSVEERVHDALATKGLRATTSGGQTMVTGDTYNNRVTLMSLGRGRREQYTGQYVYEMPAENAAELAYKLGAGDMLPAEMKSAIEARIGTGAVTGAVTSTEAQDESGLTPLRGSEKQIKWANDIRKLALRMLQGNASPEAAKLREKLKGTSDSRYLIDNRFDLGSGYGGRVNLNLAKSITDADLERMRRRLVMVPTSDPTELVWMAEAAMDTLHERPDRFERRLLKAAGHKYIKRVPTGKPKPKYRYYYRDASGAIVSSADLKAGSKFKLEHKGQAGHFEVHGVDSGVITAKHDESGQTIRIREHDLHAWMRSKYEAKGKAALEAAKKPSQEKKPSQAKKPQAAKTPAAKEGEPLPRKAPAPKLAYVDQTALGTGGFDQIEGFSDKPETLESIAEALPQDREYAIVKQARGFVLASKSVKPAGKEAKGDSTQIYLKADGGRGIQKVDAEWVVMEAADLIPSHDAVTFVSRSDYPEGVQERRYDQIREEQMKIERIANTLEPAIVANNNVDAVNGAPIVTEDGVVLGGNGRTMGMQRAYNLYPENGLALKQYLAQHARAYGMDAAHVANMKQPILVRRVQAGKDTDKLRLLGRRMNESFTQGLDPRSQEVAVSHMVTPELVDSLIARMEPDETLNDFLSSGNSREFVKDLEHAGVIDEVNRAQFVSQDSGLLNEDGRMRVQRVMAARMIPNASLLDGMPAVWRESIALAVPSFLQAEGNGWDMRDSLQSAIKLDRDMAAKGFKRTASGRADYMSQMSMFEQRDSRPLTHTLLAILHEHGGKVRGFPARMKQVALEAHRQQHDHGAVMSMFAEPKKELPDVLKDVFGVTTKADEKVASRREVADLRKAGVSPEALEAAAAYVNQTVLWELDNLMRAALWSASPKNPPSGSKIVGSLRSFIQEQAKADPKFARALGMAPVLNEQLEALVASRARASVSELAKSLAQRALRSHAQEAWA